VVRDGHIPRRTRRIGIAPKDNALGRLRFLPCPQSIDVGGAQYSFNVLNERQIDPSHRMRAASLRVLDSSVSTAQQIHALNRQAHSL